MTKRKTKTKTDQGDPTRSGAALVGNPYPGFKRRTDVVIHFPEQGLTKQSFTDECDINNIVDIYTKTGAIKGARSGTPEYGEAPDQTLFEAACVQAEIRSVDTDGAFDLETDPETPSEAADEEIPEIAGEGQDEEETPAPDEKSA